VTPLPLPIKRFLARRRCRGELLRLAGELDSIYTGTPFDMETPDGQLTDAIGGEQLLYDMYMVQEDFVGGVSFWPRLDVGSLLHRIAGRVQGISDRLPPGYPLMQEQLNGLAAEMLDAVQPCAAWFAMGFGKSPSR
jgi:hypothetical protein